jgi:hypothetical protein
MRVQLKLSISTAILFFIIGFTSYGQNNTKQKLEKDTATFKIAKLQESDMSILMSYYVQDGDNSAVTGGRGTEHLTDITSKIIVNIVLDEKRTVSFDGGFDYYSSASTDNIDQFVSSASKSDMRVHGNIGYSIKGKNFDYGFKVGGSKEFDYTSLQFSGYISKTSLDGNRTVGLSAQGFIDKWLIIYPQELRNQGNLVTSDQRRSYSISPSFAQVINKRMQMSISADFVTQSGLLSTPFHRVYFTDQAEAKVEKLPFTRFKVPVGLRFNYYATDHLLVRTYYRYYWDNWGVVGHTASIELPYKINRFFSIFPYYRFHTQSAANYFKPYKEHTSNMLYYTSDNDLAKITSHDIGFGMRYSPVEGISTFSFGGASNRLLTLKEISMRYGHYTRTPTLTSNIISFGLNFTF